MRILKPTPLALVSIVALFGCARAPEGPPIVLRKPAAAPHVVKRMSPAKTTRTASADDESAPLSASQKAALFRAFEAYLRQAGSPK